MFFLYKSSKYDNAEAVRRQTSTARRISTNSFSNEDSYSTSSVKDSYFNKESLL